MQFESHLGHVFPRQGPFWASDVVESPSKPNSRRATESSQAVAEELMTAQAGATWTESEFVLRAGPATDEVEDQYDYGNNQKQVN